MTANDFAAWLAQTSLSISVLIAVILIIRRPLARRFGAEIAYLLWLAPLARLFVPEIEISWALWRSKIAIEPAPIDNGAVILSPMAADFAASGVDLAAPALAIWGAGAVAFLAIHWLRQSRFTTELRASAGAPCDEAATEIQKLAAESGLAWTPEIIVAQGRTGPMVAGFFRPIVVLPENFWRDYAPVERTLALSHEFAHIRRGDLPARLAALVFRAVQWPNPLAHFAFGAFSADQEAACDAAVLARNAGVPNVSYAYGAAMIKAAGSRYAAPASSLAMSNHLKERLMLMKEKTKSSAATGRALAAALIAIGVAASANYSYAAPKPEGEAAKTERKTQSISVIKVDDGEKLKIDGVKDAGKIEVREENGQRTVRVWDKKGELLSENVYGPGEKMPYETVVVIDSDGKSQTIDIAHPPLPPTPPGDFEWSAGDETGDGAHKIVVITSDGDGPVDAKCPGGGEATVDVQETVGKDGKRNVTKKIICHAPGANAKDPAARAEALRKAIEHREKMLDKLRAELAVAEAEAAKK